MMLNTRPIGLVFKQHPRDPANVNARKNMCDPYNKFFLAAQTCMHFMKILTVYTLNSHLLTLKAHNHKMYVFVVH